MASADGLVAGRYRVGPCLGSGGMGRVWLARDEVLQRDVAIKEIVFPFGLPSDEREEMRDRMLREARAAARINHPNVVRIYDVQHGDTRPWIVMEHVAGRSLAQLIKECGPLQVGQVAGVGLAVLSALEAANRVGVLHRDVKPSNVLIAHDGRVVLSDFGSAMIDEGEGALSRAGLVLGSPHYIAPERARTGNSTPASDLWSLGATLYEAVEGRPPYSRETTMAILVALATRPPDPMERAGALKPVLNGLLRKDPRHRMKAAELEKRLQRLAEVQHVIRLREIPSARAVVPLGERRTVALPMGRVRRRRTWQVATAATASVGVIALGVTAVALNNTIWSTSGTPEIHAVWGQDMANNEPTPQAVSPGEAPAGPALGTSTLPAGFIWFTAQSGFRVAAPAGWTTIAQNWTEVRLRAPSGAVLLGVQEWPAERGSDPLAALTRVESGAKVAKYQRIRMELLPGRQGAEWEYAFTDPRLGRLHQIDRMVLLDGGAYLLRWQTPETKWRQQFGTFTAVATTLRPPPQAGRAVSA